MFIKTATRLCNLSHVKHLTFTATSSDSICVHADDELLQKLWRSEFEKVIVHDICEKITTALAEAMNSKEKYVIDLEELLDDAIATPLFPNAVDSGRVIKPQRGRRGKKAV